MRLLLLSTVCTTLAWICSPAPGDEMATTTYTLMLVRNTCDTPPEEEVWDVKRVQFFRRNSSSGKLEEVRWDSIQASGYHPFDKGSKRTSVFEPERVGADDDRFWSGRWDRHKRSWIRYLATGPTKRVQSFESILTSFEFKAPVKEGPLAVDEIRIVQPGKWSASKVNVSVHVCCSRSGAIATYSSLTRSSSSSLCTATSLPAIWTPRVMTCNPSRSRAAKLCYRYEGGRETNTGDSSHWYW